MASIENRPATFQRDDQIDITDIVRTVARRWRQIGLVAILGTLIALRTVMISYPQFKVYSSLYLGDAQSSAGGGGGDASGVSFLSDFQSVSDVETQIRLLEANALVEQAVAETGLNASIRPKGTGPLPYWKWRFKYGESVDAFEPQPNDLQVLYATLPDRGSRGAGFDVLFGDNGHFDLRVGGGWFSQPRTVFSGELNQPAAGAGVAFLLKSGPSGYVPPAGSEYLLSIAPVRAVAAGLIGGPLVISSSGGTGGTPTKLADMLFLWNNPYQGQAFLDQLMQDFIATQLAWKTQSASATEDFVAGQLQKITDSLRQADDNLAAYQSKTGIVDPPANAQAVISQLSQYEVQRATIMLQQEDLQQLSQVMTHPDGDLNPYLVTEANDPQLASLSSLLASAEIQLQAQRTQFTANADEVQTQEATIAKIEEAIRTLIANDQASASRNLVNMDQLIASYEAKLKTMPAESLQVIALTRSSDVFGQLYVLLMQKEEEAEVSKAATIVDTRVVTPAEFPLVATSPKAPITVFTGLFLGLAAGIALVLGQRAISGKFQSEEEVRRAAGVPVYAVIPKRSRSESVGSIFSARPQSEFAEAFRLLRANIYQSASGSKSRLILVTSSTSGDGKTTVATNLAKTLADDGKRVVQVDADLHRGRVHTPLKLAQAPGLTEWLVTTQRPRLQAAADQRFAVLTAGMFPPNPSELLNEAMLGDIFETLRQEFEYIIVDCPPLPTVVDTMTLAKFADLILSVVHVAHTGRRQYLAHLDAVAGLDRRHGVIINGVISRALGYIYGYNVAYGYAYGYGYGEGETKTWSGRLLRLVAKWFGD